MSRKAQEREIVIVKDGGPVDEQEVADLLAKLITKGDYIGYVKKCMDRNNHGEING